MTKKWSFVIIGGCKRNEGTGMAKKRKASSNRQVLRPTSQSPKPKKKKKTVPPQNPHLVRKSLFLVFALVVALLASALNLVVVPMFGTITDKIMGTAKMNLDADVRAATVQQARETADQVETEGAVLLKNDGTLPLAGLTRVNVFGWASTEWLGGGSGSGGISSVDVDLLGALEAAGIEYNADLTNMYENFQARREHASTLGSWPEQSATLYEPSIDDASLYTPELLANAQEFSDTALVVFGRLNGESNDATKDQHKAVTAGGDVVVDESRGQLDLSTEEEALLAYVGATYENVVVLLNTGNTMAVGAIETTPGVDACLLVGLTGQYAAEAIPALLTGEANPSGKTVDTWAYDLSTAPSYVNTGKDGVGSYIGSEGLYPADGVTTNSNVGESDVFYDSLKYVDYAEGIYVGYRWYETADAEGYWENVANEYGTGYQGVVQYPFGYGLSYTSFDWEVVNAPAASMAADDTLSVDVKVTNTGPVAGKDVVELYFSAPYTAGGIEKSALELGGFAKTGLLEPGASETVTIELAARDMASYDVYDANANGFAGYELEAGTYVVSLRRDAHTVEESFDVSLAADTRYETDAVTGAVVANKFTGDEALDGVSVDGVSSGQGITYLSRADFAGTYPVAPTSRAMTDDVAALNLYQDVDGEGWGSGSSDVVTGAKNGLTVTQNGELTDLGYALGTDPDDPQWDALLDQLTQAEMENLVSNAYSGLASLPSVGKPLTRDLDGPAQFGGLVVSSLGGGCSVGWPNPVTMAQTWNVGLAHEMGRLMGEEIGQLGYDGWYAPAVNMHRSPLDGRNFEYFSEDPLVSGLICGNEVAGAKEAGAYCYVKHFVCNDGESYVYRDSVHTWMTEQTLREIYLEPFRMLVEDFGATGLMSSYNRLGASWAGGSEALLTGVLRDEWGFDGAVITDFSDHSEYMHGEDALQAGGDLWMNMFGGSVSDSSGSADYLATLRTATKHVLFMWLNARAANRDYVERRYHALRPRLPWPRHAQAGLWPHAPAQAGGRLHRRAAGLRHGGLLPGRGPHLL